MTFDRKEYMKNYWINNIGNIHEKSKLRSKNNYEKNKEKIKHHNKNWAKNNPERVKMNAQSWAAKEENKLKKRQYSSNYRKNSSLKYLYGLAKRRAKARNIEFNIELDDLGPLPNICPLLNIEINSYSDNIYNHPSIDRIDSSKGYVKGNVMIVSWRANVLKNNATGVELLELATNLINLGV